ncbi:MAG: sigma 54-interacting transcriptional regulator [Acidobacteria bacterium]|nr:sigma 54-interacting transcriptional regulator [Acidobacteriota bacterium]
MRILRVLAEGVLVSQVPLPEGTFTIGTGRANSLVLDHRGVSESHAEIRNEPSGLFVRDLGSTNGVFVNGARIREGRVQPGDEILLGTAVIVPAEVDSADPRVSGPASAVHYRACLREFLEVCGFEAGILLSRDGERFTVVADEGRLDHAVLSETLVDRAAASPGPYVIENASEHPSLVGVESLTSAGAGWGIYYFPLRSGNEVIGMICLSRLGAAAGGHRNDDAAAALARVVGRVLRIDQLSGTLGHEHVRSLEAKFETDRRLLEELGDPEILGRSEGLREALEQVARVAPTNYPLLLLGETGTGKELLALRAHQRSLRSGGAFIRVNCAAVPEELIESELFGHERGAFTGATARQVGRFVQAHRGTLLLDEIGDMSPRMQAKVLRALESGEVEPVGAARSVRVDVRIIAATNRSLPSMIDAAQFRADLYFRLQTFVIEIPPLRARPGDISILALEFARRAAPEFGKRIDGLSVAALKCLAAYAWPGNVRELQNVMIRAAMLCAGRTVDIEALPARITGSRIPDAAVWPASLGALDWKSGSLEFERAFFRAHLEACDGNVAEISRRTGLARRHLYARLTRLGLRSA